MQPWRTLTAALCAAVSTADLVTVQLSSTPIGLPLPPNFVGFSIEVPSAPIMLGPYPGPPRVSFANLMRFLQQLNGPSAPGPVIRPGGSSADVSEWLPTPDACAARPPNVTYCINASDLASYAQAVPQWNGKITLDVSFRSPNVTAPSVAHAVAAVAALGWSRLEAISVGNEPDGYAASWGPHFRPAGWGFPEYLAEMQVYLTALTAAGVLPPVVNGSSVGTPRLQAADYCCEGPFLSAWPQLLTTLGPALHSASQHRYPGVNGHAGQDDLAWLLSPNGTSAPAAVVAPWAAQAAAQGFQFVIGEGNSINGGGLPNASNVFGSALWATDVLFNMAAVGVSHWDFHGGPGGWYAAITYPNPPALDAPPTVHPLFYGIWLFSDAVANASTLVAASVNSSNPLVVAWATRSMSATSPAAVAQSTWKVVVIHKDLAATTNASVAVELPADIPTAGAVASVRFLSTAEGPYATSGVSFGRQTFDGSPDGTVQGAAVATPVQAGADGRFEFSIAPLTAAVLTVSLPQSPSETAMYS